MSDNINSEGLKDLLSRMADDQLIIGHRNSEWTGLGPILEEDIAFSSLAQDKVGHAYNLYQLLEKEGEGNPDKMAFNRGDAGLFKCCHLVEYPIGEYDFSLVRHFFFDHAELVRFEMLTGSSYKPLADLARKLRGEIKYHVFHANTWITQLAGSKGESRERIQKAINEVFALALGIFEETGFEEEIINSGLFKGEKALKEEWMQRIMAVLDECDLSLPEEKSVKADQGGRTGKHTEHLEPLLKEMTEVFQIDASAEW